MTQTYSPINIQFSKLIALKKNEQNLDVKKFSKDKQKI